MIGRYDFIFDLGGKSMLIL